MVQGQECLPSVSETVENDITSRGALNGMLKQRGYDQSGMLHPHVASSRCSSIWSQVQNGLKCQIGRHQESERCRAGLDKLERYLAGMLHTHIALSRCSSIWSQVQNGGLCQIRRHQESERCRAELDKLQKYLVESPVALARNVNRRRRD